MSADNVSRKAGWIYISFVFLWMNIFFLSSSWAVQVYPLGISLALVESQTPTAIKQTTARLQGRISLDQTYDAVAYYFEYGRTVAYSEQSDIDIRPGGNVAESLVFADIFNLTCGNNYHFRLVTLLTTNVSDGAGNIEKKLDTIFSPDAIFQTTDCSAVEIYAVNVISKAKRSVIMSGSYNTYGRESTYFFKYGETKKMSLVTDQVTQAGVSFREVIRNLKCGTKYFYQFFVSDGIVITQTKIFTFETVSCPALPFVTDLSPMDVTSQSAILRVDVSANGERADIVFEYGNTDALGFMTSTISVPESAVAQTVEIAVILLMCQTTYFYQASITNNIGNVKGEKKTFSTNVCGAEKPLVTMSPNKIFAGASHSLVIGESGELVTWGDNTFGQLGQSTDFIQVVDVLRENISSDSTVLFGFKSASIGEQHSLILHESGWVSAFGANQAGQAGIPNADVVFTPTTVRDETQQFVLSAISVAAGNQHSLAVSIDGQVLAWGDNTFGQLGSDTQTKIITPTIIEGISDAAEVFAGNNFSIVRLVNNRLMSWGQNDDGQLGVGNNQASPEPKNITGVENVVSISLGASHVMALDGNGQLFVWGNNTFSQLGMGNTDNINEPTRINDSLLVDVVQLAAGGNHSLVLLSGGSVLGWGSNEKNQLGSDEIGGENATVLTPMIIADASGAPLQNIISIAAGEDFSAALTADGRVISWGDNSKGQLSGRPTVQASRATLTNVANAQVNMKQKRLLISDNNVAIKKGDVLHLSVWLTEKPNEVLVVNSRLSADSGVAIQKGRELSFSPSDWFKKRTITLKAEKNSLGSELFIEAVGVVTVKVGVRVLGSESEPRKQVVGAMQIKYLLLMVILLLLSKVQILVITANKKTQQI